MLDKSLYGATRKLEEFSALVEPLQLSPYGQNMLLPKRFSYRISVRMRRLRRIVDTTIALLALVVTAPVLVLAALAIYIDDGAPVFFLQRRVGRLGKQFTILKLRSMRRDVGDGLSPRSANDSRVTRVGRFLRKTSVDELPQLINVLRGDMALVGPRPEMPMVVAGYESWQHVRHLVDPGITGLWQATARKTIPLEKPEATLIDIAYIENMSPILDIKLLCKTALAVIKPRGAF